jgi:membrane associated rhomboid family serine protease
VNKHRGGGFFSRFDKSQLRITRGALILLFIQVGLSLVWLLSAETVRTDILGLFAPTSDSVWRHYKIWTLVTGPFLEISLASLIFQCLALWWFVPTLERWWGTKRFLIFFAATSLVGTIAGTLMGLLTGVPEPILGYDPFVYASIIAFGILYGKQPVSFFGVLPMTGRQLMYGILGFLTLFVILGRQWEQAAGYAAAMILGALLASGRWNPRLWWYKWRHKRARSKLAVMDGGRARPKRPSEDLLN